MALVRCSECKTKVSDKATACPKCGAPVEVSKKKAKGQISNGCGCLVILLVLGGIFAAVLSSDNNSSSPKPKASATEPVRDSRQPQAKQRNIRSQALDAVAYRIVRSDDLSHKATGHRRLSDFSTRELAALPMDKKMRYRIIVEEDISSAQVRPTVEKIIGEITRQQPDVDEIILNLCSHKDLQDAYDIATATWAPDGELGNVTPNIARSNDRSRYKTSLRIMPGLEEYLEKRGKNEVKHGLAEAKRRQIYKALVAAEDRAARQAEERYPTDLHNVDAQTARRNVEKKINSGIEFKLAEKYEQQVLDQYDISEDTASDISREGFSERWPME